MPTQPSPGPTNLTIGNGPGWYVIEYALPRTGALQVDYTNAPNEQTAAEFNAGTTVLGGPFKTETAAKKAFLSSSVGQQYVSNPRSPNTSGANGGPTSTTNQQPSNPLGGLQAIGDFFGRLTSASTWLRVGQVVIGLILVAVGVARITHAVPAATKIAKTVGAVAI